MNAKQKKAIASLKDAFWKAHNAGLLFWGVDNELLVMPAADCPKDEAGHYKPLTEQSSLFSDYGEVVISGLPYVDSGGW